MSSIIPQAGNITVILSAELASSDDDGNYLAHLELLSRLTKRLADGSGDLVSVQVCEGAYKGTPERSIAITGPVSSALAVGQIQSSEFCQESFLAVDHYGHGRLHYTDGDQESIGEYQACSPGTTDAWTRVLATGETFTFI